MGAIHKLTSEVKDFVLAQKNCNSALSCRKLTALVLDNFKLELSKSSVNAIIKEAGLSAPVGRTPKKRRHRIVMPNLPLLLDGLVKEVSNDQAVTAPFIDPLLKKAQEEAEQKAKLEAQQEEKLAQEEAKRKTEEEAAKKAQEEAEKEALRRQEEERLAQQAQEEARQKTQEEEIRRAAEEEAAKKAEEEKWLRLAKEEADKKAQEEAEKEALLRQEGMQALGSLGMDRFPELENTGIILLRAADSIIGVSKLIVSTLKSRLPKLEGNFEGVVENIIYLPLLQGKIENSLIDKVSGALDEIENIKVMNLDISRMITLGLREVRCVKVILSDGSNLYLDAQLYSVWSSPHVPYDFASPVHDLKRRVNKYFNTDSPLILFNAPGYDIPSLEFLNFMSSFEAKGANITNLVFYGNKLEELEVLPIVQAKKRSFIFAIWPWQFTECRKVKSLGEFRRFHLEEENKDLYIADITMELRHIGAGKQVTLYGCAVKLSLTEKTRMVVLSNFIPQDKSSEELITAYLNRWPNPDEAFQDYSRKIELFTYTANSQRYFSAENLNLGLDQVSNARDLFKDYLTALDAYVRWHLLPNGYEDKEFSLTRERFYDLGTQLAKSSESCTASFILPSGYSFGKDLTYLCHRVNEREVVLEGKRFLLRP
ncbi:MAG: cell envelope integrity protein TolA [Candidatus Omnitrophota bacterium]|nr:cell envelope integrity protein TolA [Candidatus Omnitrophota bacterium]